MIGKSVVAQIHHTGTCQGIEHCRLGFVGHVRPKTDHFSIMFILNQPGSYFDFKHSLLLVVNDTKCIPKRCKVSLKFFLYNWKSIPIKCQRKKWRSKSICEVTSPFSYKKNDYLFCHLKEEPIHKRGKILINSNNYQKKCTLISSSSLGDPMSCLVLTQGLLRVALKTN